ncbi:hypothetical protein KM043_015794 [Ampulex compressa]|nr:hypothetical protein KM043_015794 [Ampulex compressa]
MGHLNTKDLIRAGRRGCLRKQYNVVKAKIIQEVFLAEIPVTQAITSSNSTEWYDAMAKELKNIIANDTWDIVDRPVGRQWNKRLNQKLRRLGLEPLNSDPCVYLRGQGGDLLMCVVYVDGTLLISRKLHSIDKIKGLLKNFDIKELGDCMPTSVRAVLLGSMDLSLTKLAELADRILESCTGPGGMTTSHSPRNTLNEANSTASIDMRLCALKRNVMHSSKTREKLCSKLDTIISYNNTHQGRQRHRGRSISRDRASTPQPNRPDICYYNA